MTTEVVDRVELGDQVARRQRRLALSGRPDIGPVLPTIAALTGTFLPDVTTLASMILEVARR